MVIQIAPFFAVTAQADLTGKCVVPPAALPTLADYIATRLAERHLSEKLPVVTDCADVHPDKIRFETRIHMIRRDRKHVGGDLRAMLDTIVLELADATRLSFTPIAIQLVSATFTDGPRDRFWAERAFFFAQVIDVDAI